MDSKQAIAACELLRKELTNAIEYIHNAPQAEIDRTNLLIFAETLLSIIDDPYKYIMDDGVNK